VFPVRYGQTYSVEVSLKGRTLDNIQNCNSCRHKTIDKAILLGS
jgi:hypothetical protein